MSARAIWLCRCGEPTFSGRDHGAKIGRGPGGPPLGVAAPLPAGYAQNRRQLRRPQSWPDKQHVGFLPTILSSRAIARTFNGIRASWSPFTHLQIFYASLQIDWNDPRERLWTIANREVCSEKSRNRRRECRKAKTRLCTAQSRGAASF